MSEAYTDNGAAFGRRTRVFRDCVTGCGVEWMYAVDYAGGDSRWYRFHPAAGGTVEGLQANGMKLTRFLN
ncbi:hypothetical protein D2T29_12660 [Sinirhodobacter populi]|uniref:Uncharacterized protein n=1 Tax=Paenirhodobacter populi TaxID=2306993 RepID=A0A443KCU6_9RHOB|nr:hypothetical protein [Sinirhodobacter populi]RWR30516.1 hypothetical protein D2T29_12660 [Sinirhodobacter populi]